MFFKFSKKIVKLVLSLGKKPVRRLIYTLMNIHKFHKNQNALNKKIYKKILCR